MNWLKNWDETEGKVQLEHYTNAMSYLSMMIKGVSKKAVLNHGRSLGMVNAYLCAEKGIHQPRHTYRL
jgi:hypothetical protein